MWRLADPWGYGCGAPVTVGPLEADPRLLQFSLAGWRKDSGIEAAVSVMDPQYVVRVSDF